MPLSWLNSRVLLQKKLKVSQSLPLYCSIILCMIVIFLEELGSKVFTNKIATHFMTLGHQHLPKLDQLDKACKKLPRLWTVEGVITSYSPITYWLMLDKPGTAHLTRFMMEKPRTVRAAPMYERISYDLTFRQAILGFFSSQHSRTLITHLLQLTPFRESRWSITNMRLKTSSMTEVSQWLAQDVVKMDP